MEAITELDKIIPPRLEDAGLEDCALPPDSIREAFLKAATAVKSRATSIFSAEDEYDGGDCISDPWTDAKDRSDVVVGIAPEHDAPGPCAAKKGGGLPEGGADDVVAPGVGDATDEVVDESGVKEGEEACIDGLRGLGIKESGRGGGEDEDETEGEGPILAEGNVDNVRCGEE